MEIEEKATKIIRVYFKNVFSKRRMKLLEVHVSRADSTLVQASKTNLMPLRSPKSKHDIFDNFVGIALSPCFVT